MSHVRQHCRRPGLEIGRRCGAGSGLQDERLKRMAVCGGTATAHRECPGDLTDIDSALGVRGDTMWRCKTSGGRGVGRTP